MRAPLVGALWFDCGKDFTNKSKYTKIEVYGGDCKMETINWIGRISCLQGNVSLLTEGERLGIIRDISSGKIDGVTTLGTLWEVQIEFEPKCRLSDLDKASRKLLAKTMLSGNKSGTIQTQGISNVSSYDNSALSKMNGVDNKEGAERQAIPVRVTKDTFNNIMATLSSLCEDVKYAARAKRMMAGVADNTKISNVASLCVCLFTLEEIQELITLLSCSSVCPEMDFFQLLMDKQEGIR